MDKVRPGDPISAQQWNNLVAAAQAAVPLLGGEDVRITRTPHGTQYNAKLGGGFVHPWRTLVSQSTASVWPGLINGQEPVIKDARGNEIPMSTRPAPQLAIKHFGPNNIGWIALELWVDKTYHKIKKAYVVQCDIIVPSELATDNPFFFYGLPGIPSSDPDTPKVRYALARIEKTSPVSFSLFQVAMFNLNWIAKPPQPQPRDGIIRSALPRHFFWPV